MTHEPINQWNNFLEKIRARFEDTLVYAKETVLSSLEKNQYDYYGSFRTLKAIQQQIYTDVIQKVSDTWQNQVEPLLRSTTVNWAAELKKAHNVSEEMNRQLALWVYITEGQLSLKYYDYAIQLINGDFNCSQCNSPLSVKKDFFNAQYIVCSYCQAVNTFEPETKYVTIGWNVVDNIAALYALNEYKLMLKAQSGDDYTNAQRKYYERYFEERVKLMPHTAASKTKDIELAIKKQSN
ncbi:hypothetical protein [Mucilaginibacter paludis]|uniref:Uncharacterized protein n=1 Tax=Mucilaginibacter paludis DSM 18603 TaxID=714943 RepID=H1YBI0_9SPHI|nr:hypothetical protein [Mucilaginibacter paludis]EHQ25051.1 hypothetical protein Mucpa_0870 [Mucilaginibacter paludis DSM 18603]